MQEMAKSQVHWMFIKRPSFGDKQGHRGLEGT